MAQDVIVPKLSFTMTEGVVAEWLVADGSVVQEGQPLYALEAEKATQEIEAPGSGVLKIATAAGSEVEVGAVIGTIE